MLSNAVSILVVPLAGTWIETANLCAKNIAVFVVPLAGTWIETISSLPKESTTTRRSPRGNVD